MRHILLKAFCCFANLFKAIISNSQDKTESVLSLVAKSRVVFTIFLVLLATSFVQFPFSSSTHQLLQTVSALSFDSVTVYFLDVGQGDSIFIKMINKTSSHRWRSKIRRFNCAVVSKQHQCNPNRFCDCYASRRRPYWRFSVSVDIDRHRCCSL